jgi:predicted aspartyl protease
MPNRGTRSLPALCLLALASVTAAQPHRTFRIPFHTVSGMILLDATVNGHPASLLLDTGAILSPQAAGLAAVQLRVLQQATSAGTGAEGEYVAREVALQLGERRWLDRRVLVMDLGDASKRLGTRIDGFLGEDVLREFSSVRIDFKTRTLELEQ